MYCSRALDWRTLVCSVTLGLISSSLMLQVVSVDTEHFTMNTQQWTQNTEHRTPITQYWTSILKTAVNWRYDGSQVSTNNWVGPSLRDEDIIRRWHPAQPRLTDWLVNNSGRWAWYLGILPSFHVTVISDILLFSEIHILLGVIFLAFNWAFMT